MWQPSVSVVLCTYNGAEYLEQQMASILAQTYPIAEFLIFDDASSDRTVAIAREMAARYTLVHIFENSTNLGFNQNFAQAIQAARSEVIAIADQDDYWLPHKLERMIGAWRPEMPLIHCDSQRFSGTIPDSENLKPKLNRFRGTCSRQLFLYNSVNGHAMLLQRRLLPLILPFENGIFYDWWAAVVASANGGVDYLPQTLVLQRVHSQNASIDGEKSKKQQWIAYRQMAAIHLKKFVSTPNLSAEDQALGHALYSSLATDGDRWQLLRLLIRYRKDFFYQKKRAFSLLPHVKYAWQWAFG